MKKKFALIGMVAGVAMIIVGLLAMCGAFGDASSYPRTSTFDSGFASFGADYYTYSVNNSAEAASAARAAANNICDIMDFLNFGGGLFLMLFGLMAICGFGIVYAGCKEENDVKIEEIPASEAEAEIPFALNAAEEVYEEATPEIPEEE